MPGVVELLERAGFDEAEIDEILATVAAVGTLRDRRILAVMRDIAERRAARDAPLRRYVHTIQ